MQQLSVRRFCGIAEVDLNIRPLTVLIGPQASGKSLLAKLIYFFQEALSGMAADASSCTGLAEFRAELGNKFRLYFPPVSWGARGFEIGYSHGDYVFKVSRLAKSSDLKFDLSDSIESLFNGFSEEIAKLKSKGKMRYIIEDQPEILAHYLSRSLKKKIPDVVASNTLFVPAGRSFFANLDSAVWPILRKQKVIDPFLIGYGVHYQTAKNYYRAESRYPEVGKTIGKPSKTEKKLWEIIGGRLNIRKEEEFVELDDGRTIPVANLSSGQQELLPLLLGVFKVFPWMEAPRAHSIFIEEPEAHLFPSAQKDVVEFIVSGFNRFKGSGSVFMTTHSPYVLATLNNLLLAAQALEKDDVVKRRVARILPQDSWLAASSLSAYAIFSGKAHSIFDQDIGLIDASFIDGVSSEIADSFDKVWRAIS